MICYQICHRVEREFFIQTEFGRTTVYVNLQPFQAFGILFVPHSLVYLQKIVVNIVNHFAKIIVKNTHSRSKCQKVPKNLSQPNPSLGPLFHPLTVLGLHRPWDFECQGKNAIGKFDEVIFTYFYHLLWF